MQQVSNPVQYFATDNNGVVVEMPPVRQAVRRPPSARWYSVSIRSPTMRWREAARRIRTDDSGDFNATYNGVTYNDNAFFDSGSSFLFFEDSSIGTNGINYYVPSTTLARSSLDCGSNLVTARPSISTWATRTRCLLRELCVQRHCLRFDRQFDMGMPFFYGRHVYYGISGAASANGVTGPYVAFTSS